VTKADREDAGFFDASVFESKQRISDDSLKRFLSDGLNGSSVTCVLTGNQTAWRRWVKYELVRSFVDGRGLLNVAIHDIANLQKQTVAAGTNPFACLGAEIKDETLFFKEFNGLNWVWSSDVKSMAFKDVAYKLAGRTNFTFDQIFSTYDWVGNNGYDNLSSWVEAAAKAAGR